MEFEYYQDKEGNAYELKTNLEKLLVHEIFEQDKEIERLKTELQETKEHLGEYLHEQEEENKRLNNIINDIDRYIHNWRLKDIGEKTMLILNDILLIKNGMSNEVIRLKGEDKE